MWSIMENSAHGTTIGTIFCSDDDMNEPNGWMTVQPYWFPEQTIRNKTVTTIPFDVQTVRNQTTKVKEKHHEKKVSDHNAFFSLP